MPKWVATCVWFEAGRDLGTRSAWELPKIQPFMTTCDDFAKGTSTEDKRRRKQTAETAVIRESVTVDSLANVVSARQLIAG